MRDAFEQLCEQASTPLREAADEHGLSDSAALARLGPPYEKDLHPQSSDWERRLHMFYDENRICIRKRIRRIVLIHVNASNAFCPLKSKGFSLHADHCVDCA